jgi:hypothetical protein
MREERHGVPGWLSSFVEKRNVSLSGYLTIGVIEIEKKTFLPRFLGVFAMEISP